MQDQYEPHEPGPVPPVSPGSAPAAPTSDERNMAVLAHLLGIVLGFLGPLIIWLIKKDESPYVNDQGKEALNFQITLIIAYAVAGALTFVLIGCFLLPLVVVADLVFCIIAGVAAARGEYYRYPVNIRFLT